MGAAKPPIAAAISDNTRGATNGGTTYKITHRGGLIGPNDGGARMTRNTACNAVDNNIGTNRGM